MKIGDRIIHQGEHTETIDARYKIIYEPPVGWEDEIKSFMYLEEYGIHSSPYAWVHLKNWYRGSFEKWSIYVGNEFPFNTIHLTKL